MRPVWSATIITVVYSLAVCGWPGGHPGRMRCERRSLSIVTHTHTSSIRRGREYRCLVSMTACNVPGVHLREG